MLGNVAWSLLFKNLCHDSSSVHPNRGREIDGKGIVLFTTEFKHRMTKLGYENIMLIFLTRKQNLSIGEL